MSILAVPASPIGWVDANEDKLQPCDDLEWCLPFQKDETLRFQLIANKLGIDLSGGLALDPNISGTTDGTTIGFLVDSTASFLTDDIIASDLVVNRTDGTQTSVSVIPAINTEFAVLDDIFVSGKVYEHLKIALPTSGIVSYVVGSNSLTASGTASFDVLFRGFLPALTTRYAVEVDFEDFTSGSVLARFGGLIQPTADSPRATGNGTWTFYGESALGLDFVLEDDSLDAQWTITGIRIYLTSEPTINLIDDTGAVVQTFTETDYIHDRAIIEADYSSRKSACYTIEVVDNSVPEYVINGDFAASSTFGWTFTTIGVSGWRVGGNELIHDSGGAAGIDEAGGSLLEPLRAECEYTLTYDQTAIGTATARVVLADGTVVTVGESSTVSSFSFTITGYDVVSIQFDANDTVAPILDNISIVLTKSCPVLTSRNICIFNTDTSVCKIQRTISGATSEVRKAFGMWVDTSDYIETVWLCINVRFARYEDSEFEGYRDSSGNHSVVFSDGVEIHDFHIGHAPRWFHDWLRAALKSDTFTIEGDEWYPFSGDYSPNWDKRLSIAGATVEIALQDQDVKSTLC